MMTTAQGDGWLAGWGLLVMFKGYLSAAAAVVV
jgi:hypothetical protein